MDKKFKDTAVGKFLKNKLPNVVKVAGDALPDQGVLGIVKNIVGGSKSLSPEDKLEVMRLLQDEERMFIEDRSNARLREVELAKAGKMDWMMKVVGLSVIGAFLVSLIIVFFYPLKNSELSHFILGELTTMAVGIVAYYFGTSKSSSDKTTLLSKR